MCEKCIEALNRYFPNLSEKEAGDLLWNETTFPFGTAERIVKQLQDLANRAASCQATEGAEVCG
jgi:hypothetical protein